MQKMAELEKTHGTGAGILRFECPWCTQWSTCQIGQGYVQGGSSSWHLAYCNNPQCKRCALVSVAGSFGAATGSVANITLYPAPTPTYSQLAVPDQLQKEFTEALR